MNTTPTWLLRPQNALAPCRCAGSRRKGSYVEKTIAGAAGVMREALFSADLAKKPGWLQSIDARVKLVTLLGLVLTASLVHHATILAALYGITLGLAAASSLGLRFFVRRVWLFVPLFTGVVVLPATFNFVTPGTIVVPLGSWFGHPAGLTSQGLHAAGLIVLRVAASISFAVLLTLTTPWNRLLAALRSLAVPRLFVLVLAMAYRYVFHLLGTVTDMYTARKARAPAVKRATRTDRSFVASSAGALFGKSHALAEQVHMAMVARAFTGDVRTVESTRITGRDVVWFAFSVAVALAALGGDRVLGR